MTRDEQFMHRCIQLAKLGLGSVAPNPLVGCVVAHKGEIIGEGYHQAFGEHHAEVNAINSVKEKSLLKHSTLYVSLEPCAHKGKTPACTGIIKKYGIPRVVIGSTDPNSLVNGKGIDLLQKNGVKVDTGILETACLELNKHFFTFHTKRRPYVFLKWAQTSNGKLDEGLKNGFVTAISSPESLPQVHKWRDEYQSILVGFNTVMNDNPSLTVRAVKGTNPVRIVLDPQLQIPKSKKVFDQESDTIVINKLDETQVDGKQYKKVQTIEARSILDCLYRSNINSVMIEGGAKTLSLFIESGLWDEACVIVNDKEFEAGTPGPDMKHRIIHTEKRNNDTFNFYLNR
jgi:diaminohydroxyphosphoribosylaminopyrimidine deaminase/5-amino-6-(5-phosphoribosylamino)uracil reductase